MARRIWLTATLLAAGDVYNAQIDLTAVGFQAGNLP